MDYHFEAAGIVGTTQYASVAAAGQDYDSIAAVLTNNGLGAPSGQRLVLDNVQADPSGSQTIFTFLSGLTTNTYTLVATQNGANMDYVLSPLVSDIPLTSSFTIKVNPPVASSTSGFNFTVRSVSNLLINGLPSTDYLDFFNMSLSGALAAVILLNVSETDYNLTGPQLYSGPESAPTMLAGSFTLNLTKISLLNRNVYKVNYHFEINGKRSSPDLYNYVAAFSQSYDDIVAVLVNNNLIQKGLAVIDGVQIYNQGILT